MGSDDLFSSLDPPSLPPELRERALATAAAAMADAPEPDLWCRIWFNPMWRIGWAASLMLLLAGHLGLSLDTRSSRGPMTARIDIELGEIARITPLRFDIEPLSAAFAARAEDESTTPEDPTP